MGLGSVEQTWEGKGRERWEWAKRASFVLFLCKTGPENESEDLRQV